MKTKRVSLGQLLKFVGWRKGIILTFIAIGILYGMKVLLDSIPVYASIAIIIILAILAGIIKITKKTHT